MAVSKEIMARAEAEIGRAEQLIVTEVAGVGRQVLVRAAGGFRRSKEAAPYRARF